MALARLALRGEVLQNGLRKKAIEVVRLCAGLNFEAAIKSARRYEIMLTQEIQNAKAAITSVEAMLNSAPGPNDVSLKRLDAAERLNVTVDTLRNWELNGLITAKRRQNGYRFYNASDLERLNIIRTLRSANYSLVAILRLMNRLEGEQNVPVAETLNIPAAEEDIVSVCDRLILSLENTLADAKEMQSLLETIKFEFQTIQ